MRRAAFYQKDSAAVVEEALKPGRYRRDRARGEAERSATARKATSKPRPSSSTPPPGWPGTATSAWRKRRSLTTIDRRAPHLSAEQREAVFHATAEHDLAQIVGRAGAGKTTVARTIADAYREQGYEVRGAALAGKAAEGLEKEAGIPSRTLASLERAWAEGRGGSTTAPSS